MIVFTDSNLKTDLLLFRNHAEMLVPPRKYFNEFILYSEGGNTHFYIGSSSNGAYELLRSFFTRLYPCYVKESNPSIKRGRGRIYYVSREKKKSFEYYFPDLLNSIATLAAMFPECNIAYLCRVYSSLSLSGRKYGLFIRISSCEEYNKEIMEFLDQQIRSLKKRHGIKMKRCRFVIPLRKNSMSMAFNLASFIRIPEDVHV